MKQYLALLAALAAAVCHAQAAPAGQRASELRPVAAQKTAAGSSFTPRTLSAEERAELRRQLSQYSRPAGGAKGS